MRLETTNVIDQLSKYLNDEIGGVIVPANFFYHWATGRPLQPLTKGTRADAVDTMRQIKSELESMGYCVFPVKFNRPGTEKARRKTKQRWCSLWGKTPRVKVMPIDWEIPDAYFSTEDKQERLRDFMALGRKAAGWIVTESDRKSPLQAMELLASFDKEERLAARNDYQCQRLNISGRKELVELIEAPSAANPPVE